MLDSIQVIIKQSIVLIYKHKESREKERRERNRDRNYCDYFNFSVGWLFRFIIIIIRSIIGEKNKLQYTTYKVYLFAFYYYYNYNRYIWIHSKVDENFLRALIILKSIDKFEFIIYINIATTHILKYAQIESMSPS